MYVQLKRFVKPAELPKKTAKSTISRKFNELQASKLNSVFYPVKGKRNYKTAIRAFGAGKSKYKGVFLPASVTGNGKAKLKFGKNGNPKLVQKGIPTREFIPFQDIETLVFNPAEYVRQLVKGYSLKAVFQPFSDKAYLTPLYGDKNLIPEIIADLVSAYDVSKWLAGLRVLTGTETRAKLVSRQTRIKLKYMKGERN